MVYVKYSDVSDTIAEIVGQLNSEPDPTIRQKTIKSTMAELSTQISGLLGKCCYDLKVTGVPTDLIAIELDISQRQVIRLITFHSRKHAVRNPFDTMAIHDYIDIRDLVKLG